MGTPIYNRYDTGVTPAAEQFADWLVRIRTSDRTAFSELFEAMSPHLIRFAWRITRDEDAAEDIVQEAFLKVWRTRHRLDERRSLKALLYTIVRNLALNAIRSVQSHASPSDTIAEFEEDAQAPADVVLDAEDLGRRLDAWISEMPERRKEAFVLSRYHGMTHEEVADCMGLTPRTVNTHIVLALKYLRSKLESFEPEPALS